MDEEIRIKYCKAIAERVREQVRGEVYWKYFADTDSCHLKTTFGPTEFYVTTIKEVSVNMWLGIKSTDIADNYVGNVKRWVIESAVKTHFSK